MKRIFCCLLLLLCCSPAVPAQHALGFRYAVDGVGISFKGFINPVFAIETQLNAGGLFAFDGRSYTMSALIEYQLPLPSPGFRILFGGGAHVGYWRAREQMTHPDEGIFGLDGIGGIEYVFRRRPVSISGELKPSLNYIQEVEAFPHHTFGFTVRYYFRQIRIQGKTRPPEDRRQPKS